MEKKALLDAVDDIKKARLLIVGDVGLDCYVQGNVRRISPEAPVPVLEVNEEFKRLGLSCNVAHNIKYLGGEPLLVSVIGDDENGDKLIQVMQEHEIDPSFLIKDRTRPTTVKTRIMSDIHHIVRIDHEKRQFITKDMEQELIARVEENIESCDGIILQDYAKGVVGENLSQSLIQLAKKNKKLILVDPNDKTPLTYYRGADLMTPNFNEAVKLSQLPIDDLREVKEDLSDLAQAIRNIYDSEDLVITRSKDGMTLFQGDKTINVPTFARQVYDVTGAGDTVIAALAMAWVKGLSLEKACHLANYAAGVVVGKVGCVPCSLSELKTYISEH